MIIPARNEEALLPSCLAAISVARRTLAKAFPHVSVDITVVLDDCRDNSATVVSEWPDIESLRTEHRSVGRARQAGVAALLGGRNPARTWVANTDADTIVPPNWLVDQYLLAGAGYGLVLGTVEPDASLSPWRRRFWDTQNALRDDHNQIHGANLGVSAEALLAVGGFPQWRSNEDVELVRRIKAARWRWIAVDSIRAVTSSRRVGRAPEGFADYLAGIGNRKA